MYVNKQIDFVCEQMQKLGQEYKNCLKRSEKLNWHYAVSREVLGLLVG